MDLKLDMIKAYERILREFVVGTLEVMGFPEVMVNLILLCIKIVSYMILINGYKENISFLKGGSSKKIQSPITCLFFV